MKKITMRLLATLLAIHGLWAAKAKPAAKAEPSPAVSVAVDEKAARQHGNDSPIPRRSPFRFQVGFVTGIQAGPIGSNALIQKDVDSMTVAMNAANAGSLSSPPAAATTTSAVTYAVPLGLSIQTVLFDFFRIRLQATYDIAIPTANEYVNKASGFARTYRSDIRVSQLQVPLLFMFDIPVGRENNIYLGGGPTLYWGTIEKTVTDFNPNTNITQRDTDKIQGFAFGPTFIIGIQRRVTPLISVSADFLYQSGAQGGFQDKTQNDATNNTPGSFGDLTGNSGDEKNGDGSFNKGSPQIMNYEGMRFLVSVNLHFDL